MATAERRLDTTAWSAASFDFFTMSWYTAMATAAMIAMIVTTIISSTSVRPRWSRLRERRRRHNPRRPRGSGPAACFSSTTACSLIGASLVGSTPSRPALEQSACRIGPRTARSNVTPRTATMARFPAQQRARQGPSGSRKSGETDKGGPLPDKFRNPRRGRGGRKTLGRASRGGTPGTLAVGRKSPGQGPRITYGRLWARAVSTSRAKAAGSLTASSARTFRSRMTPAFLSPLMKLE